MKRIIKKTDKTTWQAVSSLKFVLPAFWTIFNNFTVICVVPEQVPILTASNAQKDSVLLVWGPPLEANGVLTGYLLLYHLSKYTQCCSHTKLKTFGLARFVSNRFLCAVPQCFFALSLWCEVLWVVCKQECRCSISSERWGKIRSEGRKCGWGALGDTTVYFWACFDSHLKEKSQKTRYITPSSALAPFLPPTCVIRADARWQCLTLNLPPWFEGYFRLCSVNFLSVSHLVSWTAGSPPDRII